MPVITTIIPTYRRARLLARAIQSVLDQTYPNFLICVYDNASDDETEDVVRTIMAHDRRVRYWRHPQNIGSAKNFGFGLARAETAYVNVLSDDDFLLPRFFENAVAAMETHPQAAFFSGGLLRADIGGRVLSVPLYGVEGAVCQNPPELFHTIAPYTRTWTSTLFRNSALEQLNGIRTEITYGFPVDLILRASTEYPAILSDIPCAVFTMHRGSISISEALELSESGLDLSLLHSVVGAIDSAAANRIVTAADAAAMKALYRRLTQEALTRDFFRFLAAGRVSLAERSAHLLDEMFAQKNANSLFRAATISRVGTGLTRLTLGAAFRVRRRWHSRGHLSRFREESNMVQWRMRDLAARVEVADHNYRLANLTQEQQ